MTVKISDEKAAAIINMYLAGLDEKTIAKRTGVSQSTVNLCIDRFAHEYETMPEHTMRKYHIENKMSNLRSLSVEMRKNKITPEEARKGVKIRAQMENYGVKDSDMSKFLGIIKKEGFVQVALKLLTLESGGKPYEDVVQQYKENESGIKKQEKEIEKNEISLRNLKDKKTNISKKCKNEAQKMQNVLHKNKITGQKLDAITNMVDRNLSQKCLSKDEIDQLMVGISEAGGLAQHLKYKRQEKREIETEVIFLTSEKTSLEQHIIGQKQTVSNYDNGIRNKKIELATTSKEVHAVKIELSEMHIKKRKEKKNLKMQTQF